MDETAQAAKAARATQKKAEKGEEGRATMVDEDLEHEVKEMWERVFRRLPPSGEDPHPLKPFGSADLEDLWYRGFRELSDLEGPEEPDTFKGLHKKLKLCEMQKEMLKKRKRLRSIHDGVTKPSRPTTPAPEKGASAPPEGKSATATSATPAPTTTHATATDGQSSQPSQPADGELVSTTEKTEQPSSQEAQESISSASKTAPPPFTLVPQEPNQELRAFDLVSDLDRQGRAKYSPLSACLEKAVTELARTSSGYAQGLFSQLSGVQGRRPCGPPPPGRSPSTSEGRGLVSCRRHRNEIGRAGRR